MRILELGKFYPPERGGIETLLQLWAEGFAARGHEVRCIVANRRPVTKVETRAGVRVHRLASWGTLLSTSLCPGYPGSVRRFPSDVIHAHFPNPLVDLAALRAPRGRPFVLHWHSDVVRQRAVMGLYAPLQRALLRRADTIVVATPLHLQHSKWLGPYRDKVRVIPFGLDLARFAPTPGLLERAAAWRARAGGRTVYLNVGRLVGYKGQRHAIEALRGVEGELWLAGTGPLEGELRAVAASAGVADRVRFLGNLSDEELPAVLHACDVFVFPSVTPNEAFGLVLVEAMACGKPLVACHLESGVPYVCRDGDNGLLVPPGDVGALATALGRLAGDPGLRSRLGQRGRERAAGEFSVDRMLDATLDLFAGFPRKETI